MAAVVVALLLLGGSTAGAYYGGYSSGKDSCSGVQTFVGDPCSDAKPCTAEGQRCLNLFCCPRERACGTTCCGGDSVCVNNVCGTLGTGKIQVRGAAAARAAACSLRRGVADGPL